MTRPTRRPQQCHECGGRVRLNGERWWCWVCDAEVPPTPRPSPSLRRTRMPALGPEERRSRTRERSYGDAERMAWLHSLPCCAHGLGTHQCSPWDMDLGRYVVQAVHVRARGMGAAKGGAADQVPGCATLHREAGEHGTSQRARFEAATGLDLEERAAFYDREWRGSRDV